MRRLRQIKPVQIKTHPSLYQKMEEFRKEYQKVNGINLSQTQITQIISNRIRMPKIPRLDLIGGYNVPKKKR